MFSKEEWEKMERKEVLDYGEGGPLDRGSRGRFEERREKLPFPKLAFWWLVHNNIAHPLIGFLPFQPLFDFHDWTAKKIGSEVLMRSLR